MDNQVEDKSINQNWQNLDSMPEMVGGSDHPFDQLESNEEIMPDSR